MERTRLRELSQPVLLSSVCLPYSVEMERTRLRELSQIPSKVSSGSNVPVEMERTRLRELSPILLDTSCLLHILDRGNGENSFKRIVT